VFEQPLVHDGGDHLVTFQPRTPLRAPVAVAGRVVLEPGAPVVWFTYPGRWHDVGRFHLVDGTFTGLYANVLTPVEMAGREWWTTDLFLDVWLGADGVLEVLDEVELRAAERAGAVSGEAAALARAEAAGIVAGARAGGWPEPHVHAWTLSAARAAAGVSGGG
jgi:predicted RNA-binding protein associated with RNAse of E/G family